MATPNLQLKEMFTGQSNKETKFNENMVILDVSVQGRVQDKDLNTPPGSPVNGHAYIVGSVPTGDWTGHALDIAYWMDETGIWAFLEPAAGWRLYVVDEGVFYQYNGTAWVAGSFVLASVTDAITASTTQTQVGATAINTQCARITTCANSGDSVRINYAAIAGMGVEILNEGAQPAFIWPFTGGIIDAAAANARDTNSLAAGSVRRYRCFTAGTWQTV
jgi:hypothetical protein